LQPEKTSGELETVDGLVEATLEPEICHIYAMRHSW
jgi:hypothetical protein